MGDFLKELSYSLSRVCPTFLQVPLHTPYPYITLEPEQHLQGYPRGTSIVILSLKIWSRYSGVQEILRLAKNVEELLHGYIPKPIKASLKIGESALVLFKDGQTRLHTFKIKARIRGEIS